jgi:hypothetical protein
MLRVATSSLVRFLSPKSVKGVTLLIINDGEKIYLYMPAYNKPRRIAGSSKGDKFMGTDLSYEDMSENLTKTKTLEIDKIRIDDKGQITPMEIVFTDVEENRKTKIVI